MCACARVCTHACIRHHFCLGHVKELLILYTKRLLSFVKQTLTCLNSRHRQKGRQTDRQTDRQRHITGSKSRWQLDIMYKINYSSQTPYQCVPRLNDLHLNASQPLRVRELGYLTVSLSQVNRTSFKISK